MTQQKPYIDLSNEMGGGIVSLFMYDHGMAGPLMKMGQTIMRRSNRDLSIGDRELIGAFVSKCNNCQFCFKSHTEAARRLLDPQLVDTVLLRCNTEVVPMKLRTLLIVAAHVQDFDNYSKRELPAAIELCKQQGATEQEIHDTILIASFFSMCNRYVDSCGTTFNEGEPEEGGAALVKYGYTMSLKRFFVELLPKLWAKFWS